LSANLGGYEGTTFTFLLFHYFPLHLYRSIIIAELISVPFVDIPNLYF
jgi:hypothetical protein